MSKSPDTDISEVRGRLAAHAEHVGRRAEILRGFADQQDSRGYQATADADADSEELLAADLRALLSDHAGLVAEVERLKADLYGDDKFCGHLALSAKINRQLSALRALLCDPDGRCVIAGSETDRRLIEQALGGTDAP